MKDVTVRKVSPCDPVPPPIDKPVEIRVGQQVINLSCSEAWVLFRELRRLEFQGEI